MAVEPSAHASSARTSPARRLFFRPALAQPCQRSVAVRASANTHAVGSRAIVAKKSRQGRNHNACFDLEPSDMTGCENNSRLRSARGDPLVASTVVTKTSRSFDRILRSPRRIRRETYNAGGHQRAGKPTTIPCLAVRRATTLASSCVTRSHRARHRRRKIPPFQV